MSKYVLHRIYKTNANLLINIPLLGICAKVKHKMICIRLFTLALFVIMKIVQKNLNVSFELQPYFVPAGP